jgi:hypothetical protein
LQVHPAVRARAEIATQPQVQTYATFCRHCERSEAIQSSAPHDERLNKWLGVATRHRAQGGTEDWIASSLRSSQ